METLEMFLKTGQLGQIKLGASMAEIRQLLGDPDDVSVSRKPTIWKYGPLQLSFWKETAQADAALSLLGIYGIPNRDQLPTRLAWSGVTPQELAAKPDFSAFLERIGLSPRVEIVADNEFRWTTPCGTSVYFRDDQLVTIQCVERKESKRKQLAISLSEPLWH